MFLLMVCLSTLPEGQYDLTFVTDGEYKETENFVVYAARMAKIYISDQVLMSQAVIPSESDLALYFSKGETSFQLETDKPNWASLMQDDPGNLKGKGGDGWQWDATL